MAKAAVVADAQETHAPRVDADAPFDRWLAYRHLMWSIARRERRRFMQGTPPYPICSAMSDDAAKKGARITDATIFRWVWNDREAEGLYREKEEMRMAVARWQGWSLERLDAELLDALRRDPLPDYFARLQAQNKGTGSRPKRRRAKAS